MDCDYAHISSGGLSPEQEIQDSPGYQIRFAVEVKQNVGLAVVPVGQIHHPRQAKTILRTEQTDMVAVARPLIFSLRWPWQAALDLGENTYYPRQYLRGRPSKLEKTGISTIGNTARTRRAESGHVQVEQPRSAWACFGGVGVNDLCSTKEEAK